MEEIQNVDYYKILLMGGSGKGKTYSFEELAAGSNTTGFIDVENKPLLFKGKFAARATPTTTTEVTDLMQKISLNPKLTCGIVDSFSAYSDMAMKEAKNAKKGWDIMSFYNEKIAFFHETLKKVKKEMFVTAHWEIIGDGLTGVQERRVKVQGKVWEGMVEKEYAIVLYADSVAVPGARPRHFFKLVNDGTTTTKCPPGIFGPEVYEIPNNSKFVFDKIQEFKK